MHVPSTHCSEAERNAQAKQRTGGTGGRNAEAQCSRRGASQRDAVIPRCDTQRDAAQCYLRPRTTSEHAVKSSAREGGWDKNDSGHFGS